MSHGNSGNNNNYYYYYDYDYYYYYHNNNSNTEFRRSGLEVGLKGEFEARKSLRGPERGSRVSQKSWEEHKGTPATWDCGFQAVRAGLAGEGT